MQKDLYKEVEHNTISKNCIPFLLNNEQIEVLGVYMKYGKKIKGEYRSKGKIDVAKLAEKLIGGGHKEASGFSNMKSIDDIIKITKDYLKEQNK